MLVYILYFKILKQKIIFYKIIFYKILTLGTLSLRISSEITFVLLGKYKKIFYCKLLFFFKGKHCQIQKIGVISKYKKYGQCLGSPRVLTFNSNLQ